MKKYLSIFCAVMMLTALASCGNSISSSDSSEIPESSILETLTEKDTEATTQKQSYDLDSNIKFNIASLSISSSFEIEHNEENGNHAYLHTSWEDNSKHHELIFYFYKDPESYKRSGSFDENNIIDTFTINGNKCMVDPDAYIPTTIFFTNEKASGRIHYDDEDEELVKQIIETFDFNTEEVETTKEKTTKSDKIVSTKVRANIGDIFFKIPDGYKKENNSSDESMEAITYKYNNGDMINVAKQSGASQFDWNSMDEETKKSVFEIFITSSLSNYFDKVGDLEVMTICDEFAVKQNAVYSGIDIPLTAYAFVYGDNLYLFMFTNMIDTQQEVIDSIQLSKTYQSESTTKETVTEKPTEKATEPPALANVANNKALESAKSYVDMSGFSYEELISQLEYEGFTHDEAVSAADSCGADWNAEALESAKSYIEMSGFSYTSLVSQLEYEKFTHDQAVYGADNCGADWNQQAADSARSYLDTMSMSREELLSQLLYEGFTQEQAEFGVQSVGY